MMGAALWKAKAGSPGVFLAFALFLFFSTPIHAGAPRFARLGSFDGPVEVQWDAADSWRPAALNLPLPESTRIRTGPAARVEIELDDTSVLRMAGEGLAELSDYTRLSGGQRITVISLDHGLAYFTGEPGDGSAIHLLVPGSQVALRQGSRVRLQALDNSSEIAILEGSTHFITPSAEMDLHQGQSVRVTVPSSAHFSFFREITPLELDSWSEQLDKAEAEAPASRLDLDRAGKWIQDGDYGTIWQPAPQSGWAPFREGRWIWYQSVGFVWAAAEPWGWKPYHEGRWLQHKNLGWVWVPGPPDAEFSPGDVFWARGNNMAAWGPLAPGEQWNGTGPPRQFAALNITGGTFVSGTREILPSPPDEMPKDLLKSFLFTVALPSPPLPVARLNVARDVLRSRLISAVEVTPDVRPVTRVAPPPPPDDAPVVAEVAPPPAAAAPVAAPDPVVSDSPPAPIVPGIIVITGRNRTKSSGTDSGHSTKKASTPSASTTTYVAAIPPVILNGAGPSDSAPLYRWWFPQFRPAQINYEAVGSGVLRELRGGRIDFAGSDSSGEAWGRDARNPLLCFPAAIEAVVPVYNLPGISDGLRLSPEILAGMFLGEIRYWNDPRILAANPRLGLPPAPVVLVTRSDGGSTTHILAEYLSKVSATWKNRVGTGIAVSWPGGGLVANGDDGVGVLVQKTPFALGYVGYSWARKNGAHFAAVRNQAGSFVVAEEASLTTAAASVTAVPSDLRMSILDAPGKNSYPIAALNYLLVPQRIDDSRKRASISDFLKWMMTEGQNELGRFHYAPLPPEVVSSEKRQLSLIRGQ